MLRSDQRQTIGNKVETIHLYQIDGGVTYWEGYSDYTNSYMFSLDDDEVGDFIATHKHLDIRVYPQESYLLMTYLHFQMEDVWGRDDYHVEDCPSLHDPRLGLEYLCEGCALFEKTVEKHNMVYGDYYKKAKVGNYA